MTSRPSPALADGLHWPAGRPRTQQRERARFKCTFGTALDDLMAEFDRLGARYPVLSTNVERRLDGLPYANRADPDDPGVAVYFLYAPAGELSREALTYEQHCFACDRWDRVRDNIRAIAKSIEALRGLKRWGTGDMLARSISAFKALPPTGEDWRAVLGLPPDCQSLAAAKLEYRERIAREHPDISGSGDAARRLNAAWAAAKRELSDG